MGYSCERCGLPVEREGQHVDPFSCVVLLKAELRRKDRQITTLSTELVKAGALNERIARLSNRIAQNNLRHTATINALLWVYNRLQIRLLKITARRWNWRHLADVLAEEVNCWKENCKTATSALEATAKAVQARPTYIDVPQTSSPGDGEYRVDANFLAELATAQKDLEREFAEALSENFMDMIESINKTEQTTQTELDQRVSDSLQKGS